jgi:hypothetical protein
MNQIAQYEQEAEEARHDSNAITHHPGGRIAQQVLDLLPLIEGYPGLFRLILVGHNLVSA